MSQGVIDFCEGLKTTLLSLEDRLAKAQRSLTAGATHVSGEASKHINDAAEVLEAFKAHAGLMAQALRADLPDQAGDMREKLTEFGLEAQVAMRHAVVLLAETVAKGAEGGAEALQAGANKAHEAAEKLRRDTALSVPPAADAETPSP